jgi:hypothetical protein
MRRNEGRNRSRAALSRETCSHTTRFLLSLPQSSSPRPPRPIWRLYHRPRIAINRSAAGRTDMLTDKAMNRIDARRMVQRRSAGHGMRIAAHTFAPPASLPISKPAGRSRTRKSWPRMKAAQTLPSHRRRNVRFRPQIERKGRRSVSEALRRDGTSLTVGALTLSAVERTSRWSKTKRRAAKRRRLTTGMASLSDR